MKIYIESGEKKVFACAEDWPGWCRSGKDENEALKSLFDYRLRYGKILVERQIAFIPPEKPSDFILTARYTGNSGTDFGAPMIVPVSDRKPMHQPEFTRLQSILAACWQLLAQAAQHAEGRELTKGPRGGGRDPGKIMIHVLEAELAYLGMIGWKVQSKPASEKVMDAQQIQIEINQATERAFQGSIEERGPRGGERWPLRYFFRRSAWHVLDHAWEIEDRVITND